MAQAAVKTKGSIFEAFYRRLLPRLGHKKAIWAVAHRPYRLTWKILHQNVKYEERGNLPNPKAVRERSRKLIRQLRQLGYDVQVIAKPTQATVRPILLVGLHYAFSTVPHKFRTAPG